MKKENLLFDSLGIIHHAVYRECYHGDADSDDSDYNPAGRRLNRPKSTRKNHWNGDVRYYLLSPCFIYSPPSFPTFSFLIYH